jgi:hypothetical protein
MLISFECVSSVIRQQRTTEKEATIFSSLLRSDQRRSQILRSASIVEHWATADGKVIDGGRGK